jgi:hypothetical protein
MNGDFISVGEALKIDGGEGEDAIGVRENGMTFHCHMRMTM